MKIFLKFSLTAFALMFLFGGAAVTETNAQPLVEILKRMDNHNKDLTTLRANVKMEKYNSQLDESDINEGGVIYAPQRDKKPYVRIDWTKPVAESMAVVNGEYILYRPRLKQYVKGSVDQAKGKGTAGGALAFINMSRAQLKANYTIRYIGQENVGGGIPTWHIELTPKNKTSYKMADLWVDGNGMPILAKVTENNNDTTTVFLSNVEKNVRIDAQVFVIDTKGAKEVKG